MQAREIAQMTFVLIPADQPVGTARALIGDLKPTHVIVRRGEAADGYYLFSREEMQEGLGGKPGDATIEAALGLGGAAATRVVEAFVDAERIPDRCLVRNDGAIVGFFDALVPPTMVGARRGGPEAERGAAETPGHSLAAEFPARVALGAIEWLLVSLAAEGSPGGGLALGDLPAGTTIDVLVQARRGFALEGPDKGMLTVTDEAEGLPLRFEVRCTELGPGQLRVLAFHAGVTLGAIRLAPTVVEPEAIGPAAATPVASPLALATIQAPDLTLFVEETWVNGRRGFRLLINSADVSLSFAWYGPVIFQKDPGPYFQAFYQDIEGYGSRTDSLPAAGRNLTPPMSPPARAPLTEEEQAVVAQRLADKGTALFEDLIPPEARRLLWRMRKEIKTVLLQSEEPWIPWELCKLYGEEDGERVEGPFFCEAFAITRWVASPDNVGPRPALSLGNLAVVVPGDSELPYAREERQYLLSLAGNGRKVTEVPARFLEVQRALRSGRYDGWHFSGHGASRGADPNWSVMQLERGERLTPENLGGVMANLGKARPLVFLNACQIGRSAMSLTDIGGWAGKFLAAGAGAFVGAYWAVYDHSACAFARELYGRLLAGVPIGRAAQEARLAIKAAGDPTWLAYTVFAHPLATVK